MNRFFFILIIALGIVWWVKRPRTDKPQQSPESAPQKLVHCAHCGIAFPEQDAFRNPQQQPFCTAAHLSAGPRR